MHWSGVQHCASVVQLLFATTQALHNEPMQASPGVQHCAVLVQPSSASLQLLQTPPEQ